MKRLLTPFAVSALLLAGASAADRPNIVLILSDDQSWTDYGFMGHPEIRTPHLDRLANRSATFTRGYVTTALCRPSLATLATGLYPHQHGITGNDPAPINGKKAGPEYVALRKKLIANIDKHPTFMRLLRDAGYRCHQSGKWWEGSYKRGGFTHGMTRGFPEKGGRHGDDGLRIGRTGMDPVLNFIDQAHEDEVPFFVWYAPFLPHTPHNPPERLFEKYRREGLSKFVARYYAMCEWFDETCGTLLDHLDEKGLRENTLVIYICDNGWIQNPEGNGFALGSKQSANEGGIRQPTMYAWPGHIPARRDESTLVTSIDILPTVLAAAGVDAPDGLPGVNLLPHLTRQTPLERERIFGESYAHDIVDLDDPSQSLLYRWVIEGKWKLLLTYDGKVSSYTKVHPRKEPGPQLYDLSADPHEQNNLAARHPEVVERLKTHLQPL